MQIRLVIPPNNFLTVVVGGTARKLPSCVDSGEQLDKLFKFGMLHNAGYANQNNPHLEDLLKLFPAKENSVYVMEVIDASFLAKTGRAMDDVYILRHDFDNTAAHNYVTGLPL